MIRRFSHIVRHRQDSTIEIKVQFCISILMLVNFKQE